MENRAEMAYRFCYQYGNKLREKHKNKKITSENFKAFKIILRQCRPIERQAFWNGYNDAREV